MPYEYPLGGSEWAGTRLRFQDSLTNKTFNDDRLDPSITINDSMRIADVATGTGAWALDIAEKYPGVEVEGLDINLSEVPVQGYWPRNLTFGKFDLLQDIPENYLERYDVVNVQYIMPIVTDEDFLGILKTLMKLLKPGGYLQWTDSNTHRWSWFTPTIVFYSQRTPINSGSAPVTTQAIQLALEILGPRWKQQTWLNELEQGFRDIGFEDIKHFVAKAKPSTMQPLTMNWIWTMDEGFGNMREKVEPEKKALIDEWFAMRSKVLEEVKPKGVGMDTSMTRCIGRKPI